MPCHACPPPSAEKKSYLVYLVDAQTSAGGHCVVQTSCVHDLQEWFTATVRKQGSVTVTNLLTDEQFALTDPVVVDVDAQTAAHIPLVDPIR